MFNQRTLLSVFFPLIFALFSRENEKKKKKRGSHLLFSFMQNRNKRKRLVLCFLK